jgi:hypothetical protein
MRAARNGKAPPQLRASGRRPSNSRALGPPSTHSHTPRHATLAARLKDRSRDTFPAGLEGEEVDDAVTAWAERFGVPRQPTGCDTLRVLLDFGFGGG